MKLPILIVGSLFSVISFYLFIIKGLENIKSFNENTPTSQMVFAYTGLIIFSLLFCCGCFALIKMIMLYLHK